MHWLIHHHAIYISKVLSLHTAHEAAVRDAAKKNKEKIWRNLSITRSKKHMCGTQRNNARFVWSPAKEEALAKQDRIDSENRIEGAKRTISSKRCWADTLRSCRGRASRRSEQHISAAFEQEKKQKRKHVYSVVWEKSKDWQNLRTQWSASECTYEHTSIRIYDIYEKIDSHACAAVGLHQCKQERNMRQLRTRIRLCTLDSVA